MNAYRTLMFAATSALVAATAGPLTRPAEAQAPQAPRAPREVNAMRPAAPRAPLTPRIAFVNVNALLAAVPGRARAEAGLASEVRLAETRVRLAADSLTRTVDEFSRVQGEISPVQREAVRLSLRARELELEDMMQRVTASLDERRAALQEPLRACVRAAIAAVQQRDGWHAIVDAGSLGEFAVVRPEADITSRVMDVLHEGTVPGCSPP